MTRRINFSGVGCLVVALWIGASMATRAALAADGDAARRPNVVLFLVDDMGWMDSTPYGSQYYETPNIQRLARESMRFTDAYALPLCSPTRASILTGQYSSRHGVTSATGHLAPQPSDFEFLPATAPANQPLRMPISRNYLEPSQYTLAEALRDAGYRTGHFGKWHLGVTEPHWPERQGFDVAFHCEPSAGPPGAYFSPYGVQPPGSPAERGRKHVVGTITDGPDGEYITDRLTDEALEFINANKDGPFFLNLWHYGVHGPWGHKSAYTAAFAKRQDPTGRQGNPIMASMLRSIDESLGRVMDKLEQLRLEDDTILIFYSDNGGNVHSNVPDDPKTSRGAAARSEMMKDWRKWAGDRPPTNNAPLREGKGRIYEGGQRVPLIVRWPGRIEANSTSNAVVGPIDLYPTILEAVGVQPSAEQTIDGESMLGVWRQQATLQREAYFTWFPHLIPAVSVRQGPWKLIRRFQPHPQYPEVRELYNLDDDIGETENLAEQRPDKVRELDGLIDVFVKRTGALYPQPNPAYKPASGTTTPGDRDPAWGLVPRSCSAKLAGGVLRIEADGRSPFLGTAQVRHDGPVVLRLRIRAAAGGTGRVTWKESRQDDFPDDQSVEFAVPAGNEWNELSVRIPIRSSPGIVRLYLPAEAGPVELQRIAYFTADTEKPIRGWDFSNAD
ncbi:MAG: sulfatase [Planctomycetales bacterium]|nr:sulfatase [Planctomycetales bacterium]